MAKSMQDYLKRYDVTTTTRGDDEVKSKPKKKKVKGSNKLFGKGVVIVDDDGVWQKEGKPEEEEEDEGDKPAVIEEVDVKVMQRMETLKSYRPYLSVANDGSGWVTVKGDLEDSEEGRDGTFENSERFDRVADSKDFSPPRKRHDSPEMSPSRRRKVIELSPPRKKLINEAEDGDLSPLRKRLDSPDLSPPRRRNESDLSPPRKKLMSRNENGDLSPPRKRHDVLDSSPPRRRTNTDLSPPRKKSKSRIDDDFDLSPRRKRHGSPDLSPPRRRKDADIPPPRKRVTRRNEDDDFLSPRRRHDSPNLSPARKKGRFKDEDDVDGKSTKGSKMSDGSTGGLKTDKQVAEEIRRKKERELKALAELDPSQSGRGAETVYRDKRGRRLEGLEELLRQQKGDAKPVEKSLEWGKGLAQKKELEAKFSELEAERNKPFARTRDDPDLDKELKEAVRWGDPMAHLVKKKLAEFVLPDLGASEEMKASGFIVPQDVPPHSWLKRGIAPPANRYGIKPGRHWDGVDRSTGYERDMFKAKNEKKALEQEAYLWSVSDM